MELLVIVTTESSKTNASRLTKLLLLFLLGLSIAMVEFLIHHTKALVILS